MLLVCFLVVVCYGNAARLVRILGQSGTSILTRLSAFILLAIGIQILWTGLSVGIPQMLGPPRIEIYSAVLLGSGWRATDSRIERAFGLGK